MSRTAQPIVDLVQTLSPGEEEAVRAFIAYLRKQGKTNTPSQPPSMLEAAREFIREHPEILRRLSQ